MNTTEFIQITGIKHPSTVTRMIKKGVISPSKDGKNYNFTQADVDAIMRYRSNPHQVIPPTLIYDLSQVPSNQMIDELRLRGILKPK